MDHLLDLAANHPFWSWAGLGAGLLILELLSGSGWLLWPAACAGLLAVITKLLPLNWQPATALYALLTIAATYAGRRLMPGLAGHSPHNINDNVGRLVGHHGKTVGAFNGRAGRVFIDGKEWAADLDEDAALTPGSEVEVTGVSGAHLKVRAV